MRLAALSARLASETFVIELTTGAGCMPCCVTAIYSVPDSMSVWTAGTGCFNHDRIMVEWGWAEMRYIG
jgi:hypothetical protein